MKTITEEKAMRMLNPVHPGRFLRTEIIQAHNLTVTEAAKILRVSRPTLSSLLNAKADLSGEMALRFEKACKRAPDIAITDERKPHSSTRSQSSPSVN